MGVRRMMQGIQSQCSVTAWRSGMLREMGEGLKREEIYVYLTMTQGFPAGSDGKASACNLGDPDSIPRSVRSSGKGNGNQLQYCSLEDSMDRGAW